jgi:hypothetical protein
LNAINNEMGGTCGTYGGEGKWIEGVGEALGRLRHGCVVVLR